MSNTPNQLHNWQKENVTEYDLKRMESAATAIRSMCNVIIQDIGRYNFKPSDNSKASEEIKICQKVEAAYSRANILLNSVFDHAYTLDKILTKSDSTFSPWTCGRTILELCSIASWLLDPNINCKKRITRHLIMEVRDLYEEMNFYRNNMDLISDLNPEQNFKAKEKEITTKINSLREIAKNLEITEKYDKEKKIVTFGSGARPFSDLAHQYSYSGYFWYSILSGILHGNQGLMIHFGLNFTQSDALYVESYLNPSRAFTLVLASMIWIGEVAWRCWDLYGWDLSQLKAVLEAHYDLVGMLDEGRFWLKNIPA